MRSLIDAMNHKCHPGARPRDPWCNERETRRLAGTMQRVLRSLGRGLLLLILALTCLTPAAHAVEPDEILQDTALEVRARRISADLRCLVCQNQSIDDSNASLAKDLRVLVRQRLSEGDSDAAVRAYVVARYGEFVLLRPPLSLRTIALWAAPLLLLVVTALAVLRNLRSATGATAQSTNALTADETKRLDQILKRDA